MDYNGERNNEQRLQWTKNAIEKECNEQKNPRPMITMNKEIERSGQRIQRKKEGNGQRMQRKKCNEQTIEWTKKSIQQE